MGNSLWEVIICKQPQKVLRKLPRNLIARMDKAISSLANNPRPHGFKKLSGHDNLYRIKVGDWRICYALEEERLIILVLEIAPRGGAYRTL